MVGITGEDVAEELARRVAAAEPMEGLGAEEAGGGDLALLQVLVEEQQGRQAGGEVVDLGGAGFELNRVGEKRQERQAAAPEKRALK